MNKPLYSIPASLPFADTLAEWILKKYGADPLVLPRMLVLLPSRRAQAALREAFLRVTRGKPTLLPRMHPLGEVDGDMLLSLPGMEGLSAEMPHPSFASKRLFLLARLVRSYQSSINGKTERMDHAVYEAREIAALLDQVEREGASFENLSTLAPEAFALHWQQTAQFLQIMGEHWPAIAAENKLTSPEHWRSHALLALADAWKTSPPDYPVIAAGTTGSIASTAALLKVIAGLAKGAVVLPGLDTESDDDYIAHITESHPQWGVMELLATLGATRGDVQVLGATIPSGEARTALLARALCPAEKLETWRTPFMQSFEAVNGLQTVACADAQEEAVSIALMLRETLETPGRTAALVTHDRQLARRVCAEMRRYDVEIDDSAGQPLAHMPAVSLMRLLLEVAESEASPVALLALLKHPLALAGMDRLTCLETARELELAVLRGVTPAFGLAGLQQEIKRNPDASQDVLALLTNLQTMLGELLALFARGGSENFSTLLEAHILAASQLAGEALWQGREAETLVAFVHELRDAAPDAELMDVAAYPVIFDTLLTGRVVRPKYGMHPRLKILSPLEARMQLFDRIILGGLNEGSWPPDVSADPWFNRSMRQAIGLSAPERQTGQAAHDFMMLASAPQVILTRAEKIDGSPTSPARWWVRLETLMEHCGVLQPVQQNHYTGWARQLDAVERVNPCDKPKPRPPLAARPKKIAVTQVEKWLKDPYSFYAKNILKLRLLEEIDQDPAAADFGNTVHEALQHFVEKYPSALPPDAYTELLNFGRAAFKAYELYPVSHAWWWPRFEQIAGWMLAQEKELRPMLAHVWAEIKGELELGGITFHGRADRLEESKEGSLAIVDYKTGGAHSKTDTKNGEAVQLMLLALIAREGRWDAGITSKQPTRIEYWISGGGRNPGEIRAVDDKQIPEYAAIAREQLLALIEAYTNPDRPYLAVAPAHKEKYRSDYEHLARVDEWR